MPLLAELAAFAAQLVPEHCPRCAAVAAGGYCRACRNDFARIANPCPRCGLPSPCAPCPAATAGWQLAAVTAPFAYASPLAEQLQALKYARRRSLGRALGQVLADALGPAGIAADALVPVPLHRRRLRDRTFNQADEIARPLARRLDLPLLVDTVLRQRDTAPQAGLARRSRLQSLAGAFRALAPDLARCELAGLDIAIVDDVVTTGATANGLAAALRAAGAARVSAIAVARTVGPAQAPAQPARNR